MAGTLKVGGVTLATHSDATAKVSLDSGLTFPAIGQLVFFNGYESTSSTITCTLDGNSSYTVIFNGRHSSTPYYPKTLSFIINSTNGTISNKTDAWSTSLNEYYNTSTKVLSLESDGDTEIMNALVFKGAITEMT